MRVKSERHARSLVGGYARLENRNAQKHFMPCRVLDINGKKATVQPFGHRHTEVVEWRWLHPWIKGQHDAAHNQRR